MAEQLLSEQLSIIATIDPDAWSTQNKDSDTWDMAKYRRVMAIMMAGTYATSASAVGKLYGSATSTGTFTTLLSKTASLTEAASGSVGQAIINLSAEEMASTGYRYAKLTVALTVSTTIDFAAIVLGDTSRYHEAYTTIAFGDLSSVKSIVA